jgi:beta-N-acetylhexosaminidase
MFFKPAPKPLSGKHPRTGLSLAFQRLALLLFIILLIASPLASSASAGPAIQDATPQERAAALLDTLSSRERIGQLFLVTFEGSDINPDSQISTLISDYFVGGVVLLAENDNFSATDTIINQVYNLNRQLQLSRWSSAQSDWVDPSTGEEFRPQYIPLFLAIPQEGDGYPYDQILSGMTTLPNEMAVGATWNPDLALGVGTVLGRELEALGFNMLLGPSLDILENPTMEGSQDLGTRTFGGDSFWVARMGKAYIEGVHQGSSNRVAVVAKHFPGRGASNRLPEEEVATIRKSLDQLRNFDLVPFFAVAENGDSPESSADAFLTSHTRYQGFQGNIRDTTRPVSWDPTAFSQLMEIPILKDWHANGGVMVSDNLGSRAVRGYYELNNQAFDAYRVALNALQAGNDLLYIADFSSADDPDSFTAAIRTLDLLTQKYRVDPTFAQRVNDSVLRILTLKYRLYGNNFTLDAVLPPMERTDDVGGSSQITFDVAQQGATLISPGRVELDENIPDPPNRNDRLVFITDTRMGSQCSACDPQPGIGIKTMEEIILRRYGPSAGGPISQNNLASYSLSDLAQLLNGEESELIEQFLDNLRTSNWIVFLMLNGSGENPSYETLKAFLTNRPDLFQGKRLIVFAFNAPYYLDATDISKLAAFYGLYSKTPEFVDIAAYLLFRELPPLGSLPVSVTGVYDLYTALSPDPDQVIALGVDEGEAEEINLTATPAPRSYKVGDIVPIQTGVILDHNGHPVPDDTPVEFIVSIGGDPLSVPYRQVEETTGGIARTAIQMTNPGLMEVRAESVSATQSEVLRFDIASITSNEAPLPTATPTPTLTPTPTPTPTLTPTLTPTIIITLDAPPSHPKLQDWLMATLVTTIVSAIAYSLAAFIGQVRWGVRAGFLSLIGGLLAYSYLALDLPGAQDMLRGSVPRGVLLLTLFGSGIGLASAWLWRELIANQRTGRERTS